MSHEEGGVVGMGRTLGIRREDKSGERRVPLTPAHVKRVRDEYGINVVVQSSATRIFSDDQFVAVGGRMEEDLSGCDLVIGVKEMPAELFREGGAYLFFSHVIKGQSYNMAMLRRLLDLGCTLIDYEKVADDSGRRLIMFGRFAGLAGMIDSLWSLGRRLDWEGVSNPFSGIRQSLEYPDLDAAKKAVRDAGERIAREGLPKAVAPLVCGFAGYGNVSLGAQEIYDLLPVEEIEPEKLEERWDAGLDTRRVYKVVFKEEHLVEPVADGGRFELQDYYDHPEKYRSRFEGYLPYLGILVNCIFWDTPYPRLITKEYVHKAYAGEATPRLRVIGDISADIAGSVEVTTKTTPPSNPIYVYDVDSGEARDGCEGRGPVIVGVDILPTELPKEASEFFGDTLLPYMSALVGANYSSAFTSLDLPPELKRAVIAHQGELTPDYRYIEEFLASEGA